MTVKNILKTHKAVITGGHFVYAKKADGWYHGSDYVNKDAIYPHPEAVSRLCREMASRIIAALANRVDVVVGPTVGGVSLSQWTAYWLNQIRQVQNDLTVLLHPTLAACSDEEDVIETALFELQEPYGAIRFAAAGEVVVELSPFDHKIGRILYQKKTGTRRILKRGYDKLVAGQVCVIVEDVVTSGLTVKKTADAIYEQGGRLAGAFCICNRSGGKVTAQTLNLPRLDSLLNLDMPMYPEDSCPICDERGPQSVRTDLGKGKEFLIRKGLSAL